MSDLDAALARHQPILHDGVSLRSCLECPGDQPWPCDAARARDRIAELEARCDAAEEQLSAARQLRNDAQAQVAALVDAAEDALDALHVVLGHAQLVHGCDHGDGSCEGHANRLSLVLSDLSAATETREPEPPVLNECGRAVCICGNTVLPENWSNHLLSQTGGPHHRPPCKHDRSSNFDRSICAADGWMHTFCDDCGRPLDGECGKANWPPEAPA